MYSRLITHHARRARTLALSVLLAFAAVQILEASHSHLTQEPSGHCLFCKNSSDTTATFSKPEYGLQPAIARPVTYRPCAAAAVAQTHLFARGPPTHS